MVGSEVGLMEAAWNHNEIPRRTQPTPIGWRLPAREAPRKWDVATVRLGDEWTTSWTMTMWNDRLGQSKRTSWSADEVEWGESEEITDNAKHGGRFAPRQGAAHRALAQMFDRGASQPPLARRVRM